MRLRVDSVVERLLGLQRLPRIFRPMIVWRAPTEAAWASKGLSPTVHSPHAMAIKFTSAA
jgi:hypothetical protein